MSKAIKIFSIILTIVIMMVMFTTVVRADIDAGSIAGGLTGEASAAQDQITGIGNQIVGIITTVGVVVAVVVLLVLGIKYMMGSASEKAEYKKTMIPYLVGAILIFGASAITKVVVSIGAGIQTT